MKDFNHWLILPDETAVDLYAPGVRIDIDFGIDSWPNYKTGFMEHRHSGWNRLTVITGEKSMRYGFRGSCRPEDGVLRPQYDARALQWYR